MPSLITNVLKNLILITLITTFSSLSSASGLPREKSFFVMDGSCCGGEETDPHAVHGVETDTGAFILSGKMIDQSGMEDGFIIKIPRSLPDEKIFLHEEEEFNLDWFIKFGNINKRDGVNAAAAFLGSIFAVGYVQNEQGVIDGYLVKLNESSGTIIWDRSFPSKNKSRESAIESIIQTSDSGLLIAGVTNSKKGTLEGFKSYGNPVSGDAYVMYFSEKQISSQIAPKEPTWKVEIEGALSIKHLAEALDGTGYVLAAHADGEPAEAKVLKISSTGELKWELDVPEHGELTAIVATQKGFFLSGHKTDRSGGIDASISMISQDGRFAWNKTFGNPSGGESKFYGLDSGDHRLIYDECWGITQFGNGLVLACGTGIEECSELSDSLRLVCEDDPRTTWRSYLVHVDFSGNLVWHRASSFMFDDEDEEDVPSTASEWVFTTANGDLASVVDLSFGMGIEVLR